jgi:hypothetical protein
VGGAFNSQLYKNVMNQIKEQITVIKDPMGPDIKSSAATVLILRQCPACVSARTVGLQITEQ